jgi:hypothetical protein
MKQRRRDGKTKPLEWFKTCWKKALLLWAIFLSVFAVSWNIALALDSFFSQFYPHPKSPPVLGFPPWWRFGADVVFVLLLYILMLFWVKSIEKPKGGE